MALHKNITIPGKHNKPILADIFYQPSGTPKPVVIFSHGFKGFKDWGHFNLVAKRFAEEGFVFVKFNFSHNGTTSEHPTDFADLEAFGNNNFSIEMDDLGQVIDFIADYEPLISAYEIDPDRLFLLGHSRGGGIVILKGYEDKRVKKIITWASVNRFDWNWSKEQIEHWKKEGVVYIENSRTKQSMPLYYQLYEDFSNNKERLDISKAVKNLNKPYLIVHGTNDEAVAAETAEEMHRWNPSTKLLLIDGSDHVFGAKHPFDQDDLPEDAEKAVQASIDFLRP